MFQTAGVLITVSVRLLDHLTNLLGRCLNTGRTLTDINAGGLHTFGFQIIRLIAAFGNFDLNYVIILENIPHEHGHIRCDCIADAIGQAGIGLIHVINADQVALIINTEIDHTAVRICKCDDLLIDVIDHLRFILNALAFMLHVQHLHRSLIILYSHFHNFQQRKVKIHFHSL